MLGTRSTIQSVSAVRKPGAPDQNASIKHLPPEVSPTQNGEYPSVYASFPLVDVEALTERLKHAVDGLTVVDEHSLMIVDALAECEENVALAAIDMQYEDGLRICDAAERDLLIKREGLMAEHAKRKGGRAASRFAGMRDSKYAQRDEVGYPSLEKENTAIR